MNVKNMSIYQNYVCLKEKHSKSYYFLICLLVYLPLYFYLKAIIEVYNPLEQLGFLLFLYLIFLCFYSCYVIFWKQNTLTKRELFFILVFALLSFTSFFVNLSGAEKIFGLITILLGIIIFQKFPLKNSEKRLLYTIFFVEIVLIILNGTTAEKIDEGKFNPNNCGFLLTMLFCVSIPAYFETKKKYFVLISVGCLFLQFVFTSRTAILGLLIYAFFCFILKANKKTFKKKTVFRLIIIFSLLGLVVAYIYSEILFPLIGHGKIFVFGKDLFTGRQTIWNHAFQSIRENFLFGVGSHLNEDLYEQGYYEAIMNAHNQAIGLFGALGFLPFVLFYISFSSCGANFYNQDNFFIKLRYPCIFILVVTIMSYFEICLFSQFNWVAILIAYGLIVSYSRKKVEDRYVDNIYTHIQPSIYH